MSRHAVLSPSSAHRWLNCPGSVMLGLSVKDKGSSVYADEGTAAHAIAARALTYGKDAAFYMGEKLTVNGNTFAVDEDMASHIQVYLDYVRRGGDEVSRVYEQELPLTPLTGEADAVGTADALVIDGALLHVIDLKYGIGEEVDAEDNEQLIMYAAAAREAYGLLGDFTHFKVSIVQPRRDHIDSAEFYLPELMAFTERVRATSERIFSGEELPLAPGEKTCRWCPAKAICPALKTKVEETVGRCFENLEAAAMVDLAESMAFTDFVEDWARAVRAEVERRLMSGTPVKGYKIVQGRQGARQWADDTAAERIVAELRIAEEMAFSRKLLSPTQMEKKLAKKEPDKWEALQAHIVRREGSPSVAPESDPRPAMSLTSAADSFEALA